MAFPFLSLSLELRWQIYANLLCPEPNQTLTLYCAPKGRPSSLGIHSAILRTNKQIHLESLPLLYSNVYQIDLTFPTPSPSCCDPYESNEELFLPPNVQYLESTQDWVYSEDGRLISTRGRIYPQIFKRLQHVEIVTSDCALWGWGMLGAFWSESGDLIKKISSYLSEPSDEKEKEGLAATETMKFSLMVTEDKDRKHIFNGRGDWDEIMKDVGEMLIRVGNVRNSREVTMQATIFSVTHDSSRSFDLERWMTPEELAIKREVSMS